MEFRKKIDIPPSDLRISHQSKLILFGSCFTESIGNLLLDNKFGVHVNPFGVLYNPASIHRAIKILLDEKIFSEKDVFAHQGVFHTFFHDSAFSKTDKGIFLDDINKKRIEATSDLRAADTLLITFGTSHIFELKETNQVVANCHKLPASAFDRYRLTVEDITSSWKQLIVRLREMSPSLKIIFTVSPIRHWKDGAHNNQLSKAVLLLAIDNLINQFSGLFYFPSYEIVLDELRDYRFYAEDMIHPNDVAIKYIWEVFCNTYFNDETIQLNTKWQHILRAIRHRSFNPDTEEHKQFLRQTLLKINDLQNNYPYFDCYKEVMLLEGKLS